MYKNGTQLSWKIKEVRFYFGFLYLSCLSDLKELVLGVGFSSTHPPSSDFLSYPHFMLDGEKGWGEQKIIMHRGTPAQFFDLVIFRQIL